MIHPVQNADIGLVLHPPKKKGIIPNIKPANLLCWFFMLKHLNFASHGKNFSINHIIKGTIINSINHLIKGAITNRTIKIRTTALKANRICVLYVPFFLTTCNPEIAISKIYYTSLGRFLDGLKYLLLFHRKLVLSHRQVRNHI